jgi:hypothetical protein
LRLRSDLNGVAFKELSKTSTYADDFSALSNQPIRTIVIKNWKSTDFLHEVFLRLNTGSVSLSPQELRQALLPGDFTDFIDDAASESLGLKALLGTTGPDPRMRDVEILARFLAFRFFAQTYPGRMKKFLDDSFGEFNTNWTKRKPEVRAAIAEFEQGVDALLDVFGSSVARKPDSPHFNRAIFDALIYYHSRADIRRTLKGKKAQLKERYLRLFQAGSQFSVAIESDTAGAPNTQTRLSVWAATISKVAGKKIAPPVIRAAREE